MNIKFYKLTSIRNEYDDVDLRIVDTDNKRILMSEIMWLKNPEVPIIILNKEDHNKSWDCGLAHYANWLNENAIEDECIHIFELGTRLQILIENKETFIAFKLMFNDNDIAWMESTKLYNY